jgi:ABC-type multidrug transport system fused ATPase/permease subunit/CRP-like cAMP-binding protein
MVSRCTTYVERVQSALTQLLTRGIPAAANLLLSTAILLWIDAATGALMCGLLALFEVLRRVLSPRWSRAVRRKLDDNTRLSEVADDAISNIPPIRTAGAEQVQRRLFATRADEVRAATVRIDTISEGFDFAAFAVGQLGVLLSVAIIGFARGGISLGQATASILYVRAMSDAIGALPGVVVSLQEAAPYMRRLDRVLGFPMRRAGGMAAAALTTGRETLVLDRVTFTPADGSKGCTDIDLELAPRAWRVVVGQQWSSRRAVLAVASGLDDPDSGTVRLGNDNLAHLDVATVRRLVAVIEPAAYVADASLLDNVRLSRPEATEDDVIAALRATGLSDWVSTLPDGIDTLIGRLGHHVPKTERIRLAIARAVVSEAGVVLIDDPTDALDREAAEDCWRMMRQLFVDRAVLIATTRLDLIAADDTVMVLVDGRVAESGTVDHLLHHGSHWSGLWNRHSGGIDPVLALREFPSLARLPESVLERSVRRFSTETFEPGEVVFLAGEPSDRLFLIVRGSIELWDAERRVATLHDGDHFGEFDPLVDTASDARRPLTARAAHTSTLRSLHRSALTGGASRILDGTSAQRAVYRLLARSGALTATEVASEMPDLDVEAVLDELLVGGSITRSVADGVTRWRIAGEARRATSQRAHLLDLLERPG